MTRLTIITAAAIAALTSPLTAQTTLLLSGTTTEKVKFEIYVGAVGVDPGNRTSPVADRDRIEARVEKGVDALTLRNALVPEAGIADGHLQLKRIHMAGRPAIRETGDLTEQFWVRAKGGPWVLLEPSIPLDVFGVTLTAVEYGTSDKDGTPIAPLGLGLLAGLGLGVGALRRRRTRASRGGPAAERSGSMVATPAAPPAARHIRKMYGRGTT